MKLALVLSKVQTGNVNTHKTIKNPMANAAYHRACPPVLPQTVCHAGSTPRTGRKNFKAVPARYVDMRTQLGTICRKSNHQHR